MSKRNIVIIAILVVLVLFFAVRFITPEDTWICLDGNWIKHGNPSSAPPSVVCGDNLNTGLNFNATGHFVRDNPGLKPGVWYLLYETPGAPALTAELSFNDKSVCAYNGREGKCPDVFLPSSSLTSVRGIMQNGVVLVLTAVSGSDEKKTSGKIIYNNTSDNLIKVELPFPDAVVGKNFSVIGTARGTWFFEASFPVQVQDNEGKLLATGVAQAQSDWMTENFVPFKADIKIPENYIGQATLVLKKDNPSGLPEHDASVAFPITIEY